MRQISSGCGPFCSSFVPRRNNCVAQHYSVNQATVSQNYIYETNEMIVRVVSISDLQCIYIRFSNFRHSLYWVHAHLRLTKTIRWKNSCALHSTILDIEISSIVMDLSMRHIWFCQLTTFLSP